MFGIRCVRQEVLVQTPRRLGKTVSVALFVVAVMTELPGIRICIFSTGQRASSGLMGEVKKLLTRIPGGTQRIVKQTQEELFLSSGARAGGVSANSAAARAMQDDAGVSKLFSYPGGTTCPFHTPIVHPLCLCVCLLNVGVHPSIHSQPP